MRKRGVEAGIQQAILEYAAAVGVRCFRRNTGAVMAWHKGRSRLIRYGSPGMFDLWGWDSHGKHFELEIKRPGGRLSPSQEAWETMLQADGIRYAVIDNVNDGITFLDEMRKLESR